MHILHITNSYGGTTVYKNLFTALDDLGIKQTIFVPLNSKNHKRIGNHNINFKTEGSTILYSLKRKWYHKYAYGLKISIIKSSILNSIDINDISLIHAHTFCLDGAVAYELSKKAKIPYIFAIRNTDINSYYKKLIWRRGYFKKILLKAQNIIFISPAYKKLFSEKIIDSQTLRLINDRFILLPNGISSLFLENRAVPKTTNQPIRIIYSGAFQKEKNIHYVIGAIDLLIKRGYNLHFTAVGLGLSNRKNDINYIQEIKDLAQTRNWIELRKSVSQKELCMLFSESNLFVMASKPETFGLVYVEALSQGLPIIYSKEQGFDGFYEEGVVGYAVTPSDINDIAYKIELILKNYQAIKKNILNDSLSQFSWNVIAKKYFTIYNNLNQ